MTGRPDGGGALGTRSSSGDRGLGGGDGVVGLGARWRYRRQWWWRPRETVFRQEYIEQPDNERGQSDTISVKEEWRECFRQVRRDWRRVHGRQEDLRLWESSLNVHAGQCWKWDAVLLRPPWAPMEFDGVLRDYASCGRQSGGRPV